MKLPKIHLMLIGAAAALGGCGGSEDRSQNAAVNGADAAAPAPAPKPAPQAAAETSANAAAPAEDRQAPIPAALHGRWAPSAADCGKPRGAATGVLTVTSDELRFHESRARPIGNIAATPDSYSAMFAFEGEGQTWTSQQRLRRLRDELLRTHDTQTESIPYVRCP